MGRISAVGSEHRPSFTSGAVSIKEDQHFFWKTTTRKFYINHAHSSNILSSEPQPMEPSAENLTSYCPRW